MLCPAGQDRAAGARFGDREPGGLGAQGGRELGELGKRKGQGNSQTQRWEIALRGGWDEH